MRSIAPAPTPLLSPLAHICGSSVYLARAVSMALRAAFFALADSRLWAASRTFWVRHAFCNDARIEQCCCTTHALSLTYVTAGNKRGLPPPCLPQSVGTGISVAMCACLLEIRCAAVAERVEKL